MVQLDIIQFLQGSFALISVTISIFIGSFLILKYFKKRTKYFLLLGITWIFLISRYLPDSISFIHILLTGSQFDAFILILLTNLFISPVHIIWAFIITDILYIKRQKLIISVFIFEAVLFETLFILFMVIDPNLIYKNASLFYIEWTLLIDIYLGFSAAFFLITGLLYVNRSLKSDKKEHILRGRLLLPGFISFTVAIVIDLIPQLDGASIIASRIFIIIAALTFYIGVSLPDPLRRLIRINE